MYLLFAIFLFQCNDAEDDFQANKEASFNQLSIKYNLPKFSKPEQNNILKRFENMNAYKNFLKNSFEINIKLKRDHKKNLKKWTGKSIFENPLFPSQKDIKYNVILKYPDGTEHQLIQRFWSGTILEEAEKLGITLPHCDGVGASGACAAKLIKGTRHSISQKEQRFLSEQQLEAGWLLPCVAYAKTDVVLLMHQEAHLNK